MKHWIVCLAVCALAACSGGGDNKRASTTEARDAATTTTVGVSTSSASTTPDTVASGSCSGALAFSETAGEWAAAQLHAPTEFSVTEFRRSRASAAWARALLAPDDQRFDSVWVVARCDGSKWVVVDGGTSAVGCADAVPSDLGIECP